MSNDIKWQFEEATLYSNEQADELQRSIEEAGVVKESEKGTVGSFCVLLVHTHEVSFDLARVQSDSLKKLPEFLSTWKTMSPEELWEYRRRYISHPLWRRWTGDYSNEAGMLMANPEELLDTALTPEQRVEASMPKSPLP